VAVGRRGRPARTPGQARQPARRQHRPDAAAISGLGRLRHLEGCRACLRDAGLYVAEEAKSKRDLKLVQDQFNAWAKETGLPYAQLSRICAFSIGENYEGDRYGGHDNEQG
jgi:hypothetical protein